MKLNKNLKIIAISIIILLLIGFTFNEKLSSGTVYDGGTGEVQYQELLIDNSGGSALTAYQLLTTIEYDSSMQTDFDDLVFAELDGTILKHYKMSYTDSTDATVYILIDCDADSTKKITMYYGNPDMSDSSDDSMFELFDHFEGSSVDGAKWECTAGDIGTVTVSNSKLQMSAGDLTSMKSIASFSCPVIVESSHAYGEGMFGIMDTNLKNLLFYNVGGGSIVQVKMTEGTEQFAASSYSPNVLQDKKIVWASDFVQFYVNDVAQLDPAKTSLITTDDMRIYWQDVPHSTDDGIFAFDWILVRKYVADEPTVTFQKATPYVIDGNIDLVIPINIEGSETITKYLSKPDGQSPNPNGVYLAYFDGDKGSWIEVDPANDFLFGTKLTVSSLYKNAEAYVYKDIPELANADTICEYTVNIAGTTGSACAFGSVADNIEDTVGIYNGYYHPYIMSSTALTNSHIVIDDSDLNGGAFSYEDYEGNTYYVTQTRVGNDIARILYSDSARTNEVVRTTYSRAMTNEDSFRYFYLVQNWNNGGTDYLTAWVDDMKLSKTTPNPPSVVVTDCDDYYQLDITNNEITELSSYQLIIDGTEFGLSTTTDSLLITDIPPFVVIEESVTPTSTISGNSVVLSVTFGDTITDAKATIELPDTSQTSVDLTNSEGNVWIKSLSYTDLGNYSIVNYKINSESVTFDSDLNYTITPATPSSGGGSSGGSSYTTTIEQITPTDNTLVPVNSDQYDVKNINNITESNLKYLVLIVIIIGFFYTYNKKK